jgi:hypothetical protein
LFAADSELGNADPRFCGAEFDDSSAATTLAELAVAAAMQTWLAFFSRKRRLSIEDLTWIL